jgi:hypothetical protein
MLTTIEQPQTEQQIVTRDDAMRRYPRLISHMICESLGYFSPLCAANALAHYICGSPFFCEWYSHMASFRKAATREEYEAELVKVGAEVVSFAFKRRSHHSGYMAEYRQALALVMAERQRTGCTDGMLASWF